MIISLKPLSITEVQEYLPEEDEKKEVKDYIKKFANLDKEKATKLREALEGLNNAKIKDEYIVKIIDFLPRDSEDVHKIFSDVALDEKETTEILGIVKEY